MNKMIKITMALSLMGLMALTAGCNQNQLVNASNPGASASLNRSQFSVQIKDQKLKSNQISVLEQDEDGKLKKDKQARTQFSLFVDSVNADSPAFIGLHLADSNGNLGEMLAVTAPAEETIHPAVDKEGTGISSSSLEYLTKFTGSRSTLRLDMNQKTIDKIKAIATEKVKVKAVVSGQIVEQEVDGRPLFVRLYASPKLSDASPTPLTEAVKFHVLN